MGDFQIDNILGDEIGYLEYVDSMGSDLSVVNAARVSYNKRSTEFNERDERLIGYLARHGHISPFMHATLTVRIKAPISVARQFHKHVVGVTHNSESTRYVEMNEEFYIPGKLRKQSTDSKQGSSGYMSHDENQHWREQIERTYEHASLTYKFLVRVGVAKELARDTLPMATYTTWMSTMSLAAAARIYNQRTKGGAQFEIECYAKALGTICERLYPHSWRALTNELP